MIYVPEIGCLFGLVFTFFYRLVLPSPIRESGFNPRGPILSPSDPSIATATATADILTQNPSSDLVPVPVQDPNPSFNPPPVPRFDVDRTGGRQRHKSA